jgi:phenylacetate-coenzyme A ligase PaaK-like adenylate-forming protein
VLNPQDIFSISSQKQFDKIALKIFRFQYENNVVYRQFCDLLKTNPLQVKAIEQIPFLPIAFFKSHKVVSTEDFSQEIFTSSGTTGMINSKHYVSDIAIYEASYQKGFAQFYGNIEDYVILALLPSYLEREGSSLIYMVNDLINKSNNHESGFYLNDLQTLSQKLIQLDQSGQNVILIGVTYALLDLVEQFSFELKNTIVMETGGMKGKRKELIREELHQILCDGFGVKSIHSEYGMTELLSQAYSLGNGIFVFLFWMQVYIRDTEDALCYLSEGKTGGINVIDLANINSCSFIATQDLGKKQPNNSFEVLGRFDNSAIRGCNLMVI